MNPSANERAGLNLPAPLSEQAPTSGGTQAESFAPSTEQAPSLPERSVANTQPAVPSMPPIATQPQTVASSTMPVSQPAIATDGSLTLPPVADDGDLIEKEWVTKAKQIVEKTQDDPYNQSKELTVFKADYMQKRYGKTIKMSE